MPDLPSYADLTQQIAGLREGIGEFLTRFGPPGDVDTIDADAIDAAFGETQQAVVVVTLMQVDKVLTVLADVVAKAEE